MFLMQHKPGNEQGNDAVREFHAEVHPRGEAPPENTFQPNPVGKSGQDLNPDADLSGQGEALGMPGATSKDVHMGLGLPLQGMESRDVNPQLPGKKSTDGRAHVRKGKKEESGLAGVGVEPTRDPVKAMGWDLPEGVEKGGRGKHTTDRPGAEERMPATADEVAAERH
jgi:hypothetical protein